MSQCFGIASLHKQTVNYYTPTRVNTSYLNMIQMDHIFTPSEQLQASNLSLQVLSDFWILLEELFTNHLHCHLCEAILYNESQQLNSRSKLQLSHKHKHSHSQSSSQGRLLQMTPFLSWSPGATRSLHNEPSLVDTHVSSLQVWGAVWAGPTLC